MTPLRWLILSILGAALLGCAAMEASDNERLLTAAGFRPKLPVTPKQQEVFASMPDYTVQRMQINKRWVYLFKDPKQGIVLVGGQREYQKFQQLGLQEEVAGEQLMAAELNQMTADEYSEWGDWGLWY